MTSMVVERDARPVGSHPVAQDLHRLLILRKNASELLVAGDPPFTLPCVEIPRWERVAENLTAKVRKRYGLSAISLFAPAPSPTATECEPSLYQVMETRQTSVGAPDETHWLPLDLFLGESFADAQDRTAIAEVLRQIDEFKSGKVIGPFGRPGWIEELLAWTQREIEPYSLRLSGEFRQLNASPTFALLRLETDRQALWFKAVGEPNLREFPISLILSRLFPGFVPTVIASHPAWQGWLTTEFAGSTLDETPDDRAWERTAQTLAELQMISVEKTDDLLQAGCRDVRISTLYELVDPFIEVMSQLMAQQQKTPPEVLARDDLLAIGREIKDALSVLAELCIPDSLGHLDFNPGNILCSTDQCVFLDWAEAYVGPPVLTVQYLLEHRTRLRRERGALSGNILEAYTTMWRQTFSPETISAAMDLAPPLAVFACTAGTSAWRAAAVLEHPRAAAYLRSLTRRIHVEMQQLQLRRRSCRN
jgi:hypothetical protein